jgi:hypothetical protein
MIMVQRRKEIFKMGENYSGNDDLCGKSGNEMIDWV